MVITCMTLGDTGGSGMITQIGRIIPTVTGIS